MSVTKVSRNCLVWIFWIAFIQTLHYCVPLWFVTSQNRTDGTYAPTCGLVLREHCVKQMLCPNPTFPICL